MGRLTRTKFAVLASVLVATLVLVGCGGDSSSETADRPTMSKSSVDEAGEASDDGDDTTAAPPAGEPTGRLTLGGQTWDLTYDADDPNAVCQIIANSTAIVSGMRTPDGNRVDLNATQATMTGARATYFNDNEDPVLAVAADGSSKEPEWGFDGSSIRVKGLWFDLNDPSKPEVQGELEVTC